jgi:hypothetical protein
MDEDGEGVDENDDDRCPSLQIPRRGSDGFPMRVLPPYPFQR